MTTIEAVGVTLIMGIMAGLSYPAIQGLRQSGMQQQVIGIAQTLNQAQQTYNLRVAGAETNWEAASDSTSKYALIWQYVPYATANWSDYVPSGYTITLGSTLNSKVTIADSAGAAVTY